LTNAGSSDNSECLCLYLEHYVIAPVTLGAGKVKDVENLKNNGP